MCVCVVGRTGLAKGFEAVRFVACQGHLHKEMFKAEYARLFVSLPVPDSQPPSACEKR